MNPIIITADRMWDGTDPHPLSTEPLLQIVGDRIEEVNHRWHDVAVARIPRDAPDRPAAIPKWHDFPGCTILPGLIDTHVHLVMSALDTNEAIIAQVQRETDEQLLLRALANAHAALNAGLTTVRDCGGRGTVIQQARDRIRRGDAEGPDVLSCGAPITTQTGHCHWLGLIANTRDEVGAAAQRMLTEGADFLKVMATGGNMTASSDPMRAQYDPETLRLIADIGRAAGKHSAAHVLSRSALPAVVAANYRTIEHCDWRVEELQYAFDPALARRMIDQGQFAGLTMSGLARRAFLPEVNRLGIGPVKRLDMRFACEREMIDFGVRYTLHSDAGVRMCPIDRFDLGLRAAQVELRLTPAEILRAVTATAAEAIGLADRGVLSPGKRADLIVVEGDPLTDLACIGKVRAVMKAGRWYRLPDPSITTPATREHTITRGDCSMKRYFLLAGVLALSAALLASFHAAQAGEDAKWVALFNGKDLTGWKMHPDDKAKWEVKDGNIVGSGPAGHLFSERGDFQNFRFRIEAKINDKGNSGQYFRAKFAKAFPPGYEAQINSTHGDKVRSGSLYADGRDGYSAEERKKMLIYDQLIKPDEWFTQEVIAEGNHIIIKLNGKTTVDFVDEKNRHTKGHFAFQQHDPGSIVTIRKAEVIELPAEKK